MNLTSEQQAIVREIHSGDGNILIDALAGCTKTTTLLKGLEGIPQRSILFAAFGNGIAAEAQKRMPKLPRTHVVVVQTFHALGRQIVKKHFPQVSVDRNATEALVNEACEAIYPGAPFEVRRSAVQIVRYAKEARQARRLAAHGAQDSTNGSTGVAWPAAGLIDDGFRFNLFSSKLNGTQIDRTVAVARYAIAAGIDVARRGVVDFCDLIWLPAVLDLAPPSRYRVLMIDEVQDISWPQIDLLARVSLPFTRIIAAGDEWQQLYSWRGSLGVQAFEALKGLSKKPFKRFPLTMTFRCSKAVVKVANELVPKLRAAPDAEEGELLRCTLGELPLLLRQSHYSEVQTFVLSRRNAELLDCALYLWRAGIRFMLNAGKVILEPMFVLLDRELNLRDETAFRQSIYTWHTREGRKADETGSTSRREQIDEQRHMLLAALRYAKPSQIKKLLSEMLVENDSGVLLSTVHKVKGLEADVVFLLRQTFERQAYFKRAEDTEEQIRDLQGDEETREDAQELERLWHLHELATGLAEKALETVEQEELNIEYVGITRARLYIGWVDIGARNQPKLLSIPVDKLGADQLDDALAMAEREFQRADAAGDQETVEAMGERIALLLKKIRGN